MRDSDDLMEFAVRLAGNAGSVTLDHFGSAAVEFKDMRTNAVLWSNPAMQYREEFPLNPTSAVDTATFLGQDINARERMANEFARALVSSILEAF